MTEPSFADFVLADSIASELEGTCGSLDDALESRGLTITSCPHHVLLMIDSKVVECECCTWWVPTHEVNTDGYCYTCQE